MVMRAIIFYVFFKFLLKVFCKLWLKLVVALKLVNIFNRRLISFTPDL